MELREFKEGEELKPLPKETAETVGKFLEKHSNDLIEGINWMKDHEKHPLNKIVPFLHLRQIGLEFNGILSLENVAIPKIIINPEFIVKDKKFVKQGMEVCESFLVEGKEHIKRVFVTERSENILLTYDEYEDERTPMKRGSDVFAGEYAVLLQQAIDIGNGKLITRFEEYTEEEDTITQE